MKYTMRSAQSLFTNGSLNWRAKYFLSNSVQRCYREYTVVDDSRLSNEERWKYEVTCVKVKKLGAKEDLSKYPKFSADLSDFG